MGQTIYAGSAIVLVGDVATPSTTNPTTTTTGSHTAIVQKINCLAPHTVCPDIPVEGSEATQCVFDVCEVISTGEIFLAYSYKDTTPDHYLNVIRSSSMWWSKQKRNQTTYGAVIPATSTIKLLGTLTFPNQNTNAIFTNGNVTIDAPQASFMARNNQRGFMNAFTGAPADVKITMNLPNNTLAQYVNEAGYQRISDGAATPTYKSPVGNKAAGMQLVRKMLFIIPNEQYYSGDTLTMNLGVTSHVFPDFSRAYWVPNAALDETQKFDRAEGSQVEIACTFNAIQDDVFCMQMFNGLLKDEARFFERIS